MQYALIKNGQVVNIIEAEANFTAQLPGIDAILQHDSAGIGWQWDGQQLTAPPAPPAAPLPTRITRLAFRNRFTLAEKAALEFAALDDPAAALAQRQQSALLRAMLADQAVAKYIDLADPSTVAGVQLLEQSGLLAAGRAADILGAPVQPGEQP